MTTTGALALVLDMDGTLVAEDDDCVPWPRPHLDAFLEYVFREFGVIGLWTAAHRVWYERVNALVLGPALARVSARLGVPCAFSFVWTRERCCERFIDRYESVTLKPLRKCWRRRSGVFRAMTPDATLMIDDTPGVLACNYSNGIVVRSYDVNDDDDELLVLVDYLEQLGAAARVRGSVRSIEKRGWRRRLEPV